MLWISVAYTFKESANRTIDLPDDNPETTRRVLYFLYTKSYKHHDISSQSSDVSSQTTEKYQLLQGSETKEIIGTEIKEDEPKDNEISYSDLAVYIAADKFGIHPLKEFAVASLKRWAEIKWDSAIFPQIARETMSWSPPQDKLLTDVLAIIIYNNLERLAGNADIARLLQNFGSLTYSLITEMHKNSRARESQLLREIWTFPNALDNLAVTINSVPDCRHCSSAMNVMLLDAVYQ